MSSRVDLRLLANHITSLPTHIMGVPFLDANLRFKVLHSVGFNTPPNKKNGENLVPQGFFSFDMSHDDLVGMYYNNGKNALRAAVQSAFNDHIFTYCDFLRPTNLPEEILHSILPFLYGADLSEVVLGEIVSTVKKLEVCCYWGDCEHCQEA